MDNDKKAQKYFNRILSTIGADIGNPDEITKTDVYNIILSDLVETCMPMLDWKGLPLSIDIRKMTMFRQISGYSIYYKDNGVLYDFFGGLGGEPDAYYDPTFATIANPYLKLSKNLRIGTECVLDRHDYLMTGLLPWHKLYAEEMAEAFLTLRLGLINARAEYIITAEDDNEQEGAKAFIKTIMDGVKLAFISNPSFLQRNGTQTLPYSQVSINTIRSATESLQFLYAKWASGVGLSSSYNAKREYVAIEATTMGEDTIRPKTDIILECARNTADDLNRMYGLNVSVDFSSSWKINQEKAQLSLDAMKEEDTDDGKNQSQNAEKTE